MVSTRFIKVRNVLFYMLPNDVHLKLHFWTNLIIFLFFRDITTEILSSRPVGSFVVRQSQSRTDAWALSVHIPYGIVAHYLIQKIRVENKIYYKIQVITNAILYHFLMNLKLCVLLIQLLIKTCSFKIAILYLGNFAIPGLQKNLPQSSFSGDSSFSHARESALSFGPQLWFWRFWKQSRIF